MAGVFNQDGIVLHHGDCLDIIPSLPPVDAIVTDPPYGLEFMGKSWDHGVPGIPFWSAALCVLKPGGYMLCFGGTRTYHRLACAIEDAGFEVRDCIMWIYGSGFPKGKGCLKPAYEPILLCRKPGKVLPLGIDECRIESAGRPLRVIDPKPEANGAVYAGRRESGGGFDGGSKAVGTTDLGRWPANIVHDGSDEAITGFPDANGGHYPAARGQGGVGSDGHKGQSGLVESYSDTGSAARFFYCAKASRSERGDGNTHPTVKPIKLMQWLIKLVCPKDGLVLDPFSGSGTTLVAAKSIGRSAIGIDKEITYCQIAARRLSDGELFSQESMP